MVEWSFPAPQFCKSSAGESRSAHLLKSTTYAEGAASCPGPDGQDLHMGVRDTVRMRIYWLRVLLGGFLVELVLLIVLLGGFAAAGVDLAKEISATSAVIIGAGCFAA